MLRQPINPTLIVSLGCVAREEENSMEDRGTTIPAVRAAEDLIKVLLLMFMISKKIQVNKATKLHENSAISKRARNEFTQISLNKLRFFYGGGRKRDMEGILAYVQEPDTYTIAE
jgi:hypothetical protein